MVEREAVKDAREELRHAVPNNCWATGPNTGDPVNDLIVCPGCKLVAAFDRALAAAPAGVLTERRFAPGTYPAGGRWLLVYDDADVQPEHIGSEAAAWAALERASQSWHCHLFVRIATTARDTASPLAPSTGERT
jgi:hypothetical protein